jgi:hypothetical protein
MKAESTGNYYCGEGNMEKTPSQFFKFIADMVNMYVFIPN